MHPLADQGEKMGKYVLIITAILVVLWTLVAFTVPSSLFGWTDFQLGEFCGSGTAYTMVVGIGIWGLMKIFAPKK